MNLDEFLNTYPKAYHLETVMGFDRWTSGEGEGSDNETIYFDDDGNEIDPWGDGLDDWEW